MKKKQSGFSLVEIIVVLVIMAILVAVSIPALTGYIEDASDAKYMEEARGVYTAAQAAVSEMYATQPKFATYATAFKMKDGTRVGRVSNVALYRVQKNGANDLNEVDRAIAKKILQYLDSNKKEGARYNFNPGKNVLNPLNTNVKTYEENYKQPGIVVAYNKDGKVVMVQYGAGGDLYTIMDGTLTKENDASFTAYPN